MFNIQKQLFLSLAIVAAATLIFVSGYNQGRSSIINKDLAVSNQQIVNNIKSNNVANEHLTPVQEKIIYKTRYIKEYINEKANSSSDIAVDNYWVRVMDYSASTESDSIKQIDESSLSFKDGDSDI